MPFIARAGRVDGITVPAGQSIIVSSQGAGQTKVYYGQPYPAGNLPTMYALQGIVAQGSTTFGPFASAQVVRIEASYACDIEYEIGTSPRLASSSTTANALTAHAGGGQSGATAITAAFSRFTTVATAGDSAVLPPSVAGVSAHVRNDGANSMNVFPNGSTDVINALGSATAFAVAAGKSCDFFCCAAGQWSTNLSA